MKKKRYIITIISLTLASFFSTGQIKNTKISKVIDVPFQIINGYFVKNTFTDDTFPKAKITTQKEFDKMFGAAVFMGKNGMPTLINFKEQYVIAVLEKETDLNTTVTPINLKKVNNKILFEYRVLIEKPQSFTIRPLMMILVDKKHIGKIEIIKSNTKDEISDNKAIKMINNQWIIAFFNNPERNVELKNCHITINSKLGNFNGNDGCNIINGKVEINADSISFKNMSRTMMACEKMEQGDVFVKNLIDVNKYKIIGGELFLYKNNVLLMTLESFK